MAFSIKLSCSEVLKLNLFITVGYTYSGWAVLVHYWKMFSIDNDSSSLIIGDIFFQAGMPVHQHHRLRQERAPAPGQPHLDHAHQRRGLGDAQGQNPGQLKLFQRYKKIDVP